MAEYVLNEENWHLEANAVINDIKAHVSEIFVSQVLASSDARIFFNVKTLERQQFCIELSGMGFRVVGKLFDESNIDSKEYFETPYSLLNDISPQFQASFGDCLANKLLHLLN